MLSHMQEIFDLKCGEEYESFCQWLGRKTLDLNKFNKDKLNKTLKKNIEKIDKAYRNMR